ncbi:radial spoke head 1 homolog [Pollicipes pollicipes]|uniref:radial spoke head 1 homolog n=1 Tax=Pollicipes pollicipes TaxID=41117 RepID=UPI001884A477|nr:radial spoke head 1 homolog [Pollicipes pollicipes]XP_037083015.1 radial spoke head 1 homolog [Pollicipes pollicipes]
MLSVERDAETDPVEQRPGEKTGNAEFRFPNGDSYNGGYRIWPEEKAKSYGIVRHGDGTYTTSDGDQYTGTWAEDTLDGAVTICFVDGSTFSGTLQDGQYAGPGRYSFPDGSYFEGTFTCSQISGEGVWMDAHGQEWRGQFATDKALSLRFKHNL